MKPLMKMILCLLAAFPLSACSGDGTPASNRTVFTLDANASGAIETINNIVNMTVASKDASDLKAEYRAGFVQGKLQGKTIVSARDNNWDNAYLTVPSHSFPKQHGPTRSELEVAGGILNANYTGFIALLEKSRHRCSGGVPAEAPPVQDAGDLPRGDPHGAGIPRFFGVLAAGWRLFPAGGTESGL